MRHVGRAIDPAACKIGRQCQHAQGQNQGGHRHGSSWSAAAISRGCSMSDREVLSHLESKKRRGTRNASAMTTRCGRSCSWYRPGRPDATFEDRRKEAEALRSRFRGCDGEHSDGARDAGRRRARSGHSHLGRSAGRAAQGPRQRARRAADGAGSHPARHRDVCGLLQERDQDRHARAGGQARETVLGQSVRSRNRSDICGSCARTR